MRTWKRILIPLVLIIVFVLIISSFFKPSANNHYIDYTLTSAYGVDADGDIIPILLPGGNGKESG